MIGKWYGILFMFPYLYDMYRSKVLERGQVTIPKAIRKRLGIGPGSMLEFKADGGRLVAEKVESANPVDAVYGSLGSGRHTDDILRELRGME